MQSYYPAPNRWTESDANNYFASGGPILSRNYFDAKVNYTVNDKQPIWGKYGRMWATSGGQAVFGIAGGPGLGGSDPGLGDTLIQVATIGHTHTLSHTLILDGVFGYERQGQTVMPNDFGTNYRTAVRHSEHQRSGSAAERLSQYHHLAATPASACRTGCR